jgi:hypothetical protein
MNAFVHAQLKLLFWDYDLEAIDFQTSNKFIIERVLEKGNFENVKTLLKMYGEEKILNIINNSTNISKATQNFWNLYFKSK